MGVLQPWLLALGLGVAVPLLLHLFQRHQGPRVIFPALRYLRRAERESARRVRLRQWLLLLLRVAAVLLLALAAARPFLQGAGGMHEPTAVALILDNSLSTGAVVSDRRVFDDLQQRALEVLQRAGPDDRFWLLRTASPQEPAVLGNAAATAARVRATEPTGAAGDLGGALARARTILAAGAEGRAQEIHLLSDLQRSELRGVAALGASPPLLVWAGPPAAPANRAITEIRLGTGLAPLAGQRTALSALVAGAGEDSLTLRLFLAGRLAAAATAPTNTAVSLLLPAQPAGLTSGWVETDPDGLSADDRRYFVVRVLPPPRVAAPGASQFLAEALQVMAGAGRVRPAENGLADVVFLSGAQPQAGPRGSGTVVVLPPAEPVTLPALNRQLATLGIPWRYASPDAQGEVRLAVTDTTDPVLQLLRRVRLARHYPLVAGSSARADSVLLRSAAGIPWAVRGVTAGGTQYVLLGSPLDPQASSIPTSAAMIPLLERIVGGWAAPGAESAEAAMGDEVPLPPGTTHVLRPDSVREPVLGGAYPVPAVPGVYQALAGDSVRAAFAVNPPARESALARAEPGELDRVFSGWTVRSTASAGRWGRLVFRARLGLELWRPFLFLLLAVLAAEAVLAATGGARPRTSQETQAMATD